jgi:hypothetical protein
MVASLLGYSWKKITKNCHILASSSEDSQHVLFMITPSDLNKNENDGKKKDDCDKYFQCLGQTRKDNDINFKDILIVKIYGVNHKHSVSVFYNDVQYWFKPLT